MLTVVYAAGAMMHARGKPFWYDEVFTVMSAMPADLAGSWQATQKLDTAPPLTRVLTHFAVSWLGHGEIPARLRRPMTTCETRAFVLGTRFVRPRSSGLTRRLISGVLRIPELG